MYQVTQSQTEQNVKLVSSHPELKSHRFSHIFIKLLQIQIVKKYRCLYDHNDTNYKNSAFVEKGWQDVSKEFGEPVSECKKKWRHLRSSLSRYLKLSRDEMKNKNNKLKPYYLLTHMNFLVPYTKTLDTKNDTVISNKSFDESHFHDMKTDEEQTSIVHEIMQDEDSANEMETNIVYEAYEIAEPLSASTSTGQSQGKSQITLVRSSNANTSQNVQQISVNHQLAAAAASPQKSQTQIHQIQQQSQQTTTSSTAQAIPVQNTIYPVSDDQSSADLNFFLALLPDVKIMNQEQKRVFRLGALKLIDEILSGNR